MFVYVVVPRLDDAAMEGYGPLDERTQFVREQHTEALAELRTLTAGGYSEVKTYTHTTDYGEHDVYVLDRLGDQTQIDPQSARAG